MYILVSYLSTNYKELREHWRKHSVLKKQGKRGSDRPFLGELGGKVELIDWQTKSIKWEMKLNSPAGVYYDSLTGLIFVNSLQKGQILCVSMKEKRIVEIINNQYFNKPHTLTRTKKGFLVSSTGLDAIIEVDMKGETIYSFFFNELWYPIDQMGNRRAIDLGKNHQGVEYPSLNQTTHVNYARYLDNEERYIVATLFHPGELVVVDRASGDVSIKMSGLKNPHNFKPAGNNFILCNTSRGHVFIMDKFFNVINTVGLNKGLSWVQDAFWSSESDTIFIADADNHRIVEFNCNSEQKGEYAFSENFRIFEVCMFSK